MKPISVLFNCDEPGKQKKKVKRLLAELKGLFTLKEDQRTGPRAFLGGRHVFASVPTGLDKSLAEHRGALRLTTVQ